MNIEHHCKTYSVNLTLGISCDCNIDDLSKCNEISERTNLLTQSFKKARKHLKQIVFWSGLTVKTYNSCKLISVAILSTKSGNYVGKQPTRMFKIHGKYKNHPISAYFDKMVNIRL